MKDHREIMKNTMMRWSICRYPSCKIRVVAVVPGQMSDLTAAGDIPVIGLELRPSASAILLAGLRHQCI
jgi:hypothetical protein